MSGILVKYDRLIKDIEFFREIGEKYRIERSGNSLALYVNGLKYFTSTVNATSDGATLPSKQLFFIQKVKNYILKNDLVKKIKKNYRKPSDIGYICLNDDCGEGEVFEKPYSIDITAAYWESAYKNGWISNEIYIQGKGIDKRIRLASLGTFAKRVYHYEFSGKEGDDETLTNVENPKYPHVFFNQANTIYHIMDDCRIAAKDDFLFYWTDGIYVKTLDAAKAVESILQQKGYDWKTEKLVNIIRHHNGFQTTELKKMKNGKSERKIKMYKAGIR